jgi:hypothetical protein
MPARLVAPAAPATAPAAPPAERAYVHAFTAPLDASVGAPWPAALTTAVARLLTSGGRLVITVAVDPAPSRDIHQADETPSATELWSRPSSPSEPIARTSAREEPIAAVRRLAALGQPPLVRQAWAQAVPGLSARVLRRAVAAGVLRTTLRGTSRGHRAQLITAADLVDFLALCEMVAGGRVAPPAWYDHVSRTR